MNNARLHIDVNTKTLIVTVPLFYYSKILNQDLILIFNRKVVMSSGLFLSCSALFFRLQMCRVSVHINEMFCTHRVVHMTVCLSDSQLHLFLQTQLPVSHIQDCVKGDTPYSVTEAILTYASSNRGWTQEEEDGLLEPCPTPISYESIERYR